MFLSEGVYPFFMIKTIVDDFGKYKNFAAVFKIFKYKDS